MDSQDFLKELILNLEDGDAEVNNLAFKDNEKDAAALINEFDSSKMILTVSSKYLNENISDLQVNRYLKAIISLPIYHEQDNLVMLTFDSKKTDNECLVIDESDSLIHRKDSNDWTFIKNELMENICESYHNFNESDIALKADISEFSSSISQQLKSDAESELLTLKSKSPRINPRKNRVISDSIIDDMLSLKEQSIRSQISKHSVRLDDIADDKSINFTFLSNAMYSKKRQNPENLLYRDNKRIIDGDVIFRKLGKIADLKNIDFKNDKDTILIATCKSCTSKYVNYNHDIDSFNGEIFIEIDNINESVLKEYLYEYLSSDNGLDEIRYFSKDNYYITPENIKQVKIPVPPLEIQKEIVKVARESREFFKTVELLKKQFNSNILDYKHMKASLDELKGDIKIDSESGEVTKMSRSWRHVYKGLIWPLAISYLSATKGGFELVEKKDNYLVLFEFIAAFNSIILLSGLPEDVYKKNFKKIWNAFNFNVYKNMTFGNWVYLSKNLADVYRNNNFTSQLDEELFEMISSDKILDALEKAKDLRNEEHHGSHSNSFEAEKIIEKLDGYLDDIFDILEVYSNYKLIYVTGDVDTSKRNYNHRVILLNGPCAQPIYDNIIFDNVLFGDSLYLYNPKNNKKLLIKDNLMKFKPVDDNRKRWALFIYYSCDKSEYNAFYKCFQSNEKDVKESITSLKKDILL
ncbi:restriction endonuclease subunit S [uncultured Methanobrevibacter sp.]|uniref:restriction endonuclease subunit S n=1 Tax=uncultured Methanobrevibacter sp. TaxID=253161 RepID=UPI0025F45907|nr:restriction endonuclease subunit S [uncultured Methanobrevibacter sp.]